jgi:hypothetical protein
MRGSRKAEEASACGAGSGKYLQLHGETGVELCEVDPERVEASGRIGISSRRLVSMSIIIVRRTEMRWK